MKEVFLVWYGGGIVGVYSNRGAADAVAKARNDYAVRSYGGKRRIEAKVEPWDVQEAPAPEDL